MWQNLYHSNLGLSWIWISQENLRFIFNWLKEKVKDHNREIFLACPILRKSLPVSRAQLSFEMTFPYTNTRRPQDTSSAPCRWSPHHQPAAFSHVFITVMLKISLHMASLRSTKWLLILGLSNTLVYIIELEITIVEQSSIYNTSSSYHSLIFVFKQSIVSLLLRVRINWGLQVHWLEMSPGKRRDRDNSF